MTLIRRLKDLKTPGSHQQKAQARGAMIPRRDFPKDLPEAVDLGYCRGPLTVRLPIQGFILLKQQEYKVPTSHVLQNDTWVPGPPRYLKQWPKTTINSQQGCDFIHTFGVQAMM